MSGSSSVERVMWWLDVTGFPDLLWARLKVLRNGTAQVLDLDGKLREFSTEQAACEWLLADEYERLESIDGDDLRYAGITRDELVPPSAGSDAELVPKMLVRHSVASPPSAG
jgi:hypothetical protein